MCMHIIFGYIYTHTIYMYDVLCHRSTREQHIGSRADVSI